MNRHLQTVILLLLLTCSQAWAQKPVYTFKVLVGVHNNNKNLFNGQSNVEAAIYSQFQKINAIYNREPRFQGVYNFSVDRIYYYDGDPKLQTDQAIEAGYDFRVVYDGCSPCASYGGDYNIIRVRDNVWYQAYSVYMSDIRNTDAGAQAMAHELAHARGTADMYAFDVQGDVNQAKPGLAYDFNASISSDPWVKAYIMYNANSPEVIWDDFTINLLNYTKGDRIADWAILYQNIAPQKVAIRVKDQSGSAISNAEVKMYGQGWYASTFWNISTPANRTPLDNIAEYTLSTAANGEVSFNGKNEFPFQFFTYTSGKFWNTNYSNFLVKVTYQGQEQFKWMPATEVFNTYLTNPAANAYYLDFTMNVSACTIPAWNATTAYSSGAQVSYLGKKYTANWWNQNTKPSENAASGQAWTDNGACGSSNVKPTVSITAPTNNTTFTNLNPISVSVNAADTDGSVASVKYSFTGQADKVVTGANPFTTSFTPTANGTYTITAVATDNLGLASDPATITVTVNQATNTKPAVTFVAPANNTTFTNLNPISVSVNATDNGSVASVKYSFTGQADKVVTGANPFATSFTPTANGTYTITAVATDNLGLTSDPATITVTVNQATNTKPAVTFVAPANNTTFTNLNPISVSVNATDNGSVASVKYSFTGQADKVVTGANPFATSFTPTANGTYTITAVATDNLGLASDPATITVTVNQATNTKPAVTFVAPANNTTFTNLNPISVSVNATDNGSVASVKYSFTGQADKVVTGANPFATSFTPTANGTYTITAVATDNLGLTSDPATITVVVNQTSGGCTAPQYVAGTTYATGAFVQNQGNKYQCTVGGWCSSNSSYYYAPGTGTAWQSAWSLVGPCTSRMAAEAAASLAFSMYPNPTDGKLSFNINTEEITVLQVSIINNYGAEVSVQRISVNESLDMASLPQGLYTIKITAGDFVWTERIVKK